MAVMRTPPRCPECGKNYKAIYKDYSDLPMSMRPLGDNFIRWDYEGHKCNPIRKAVRKLKGK